MRKILINKKVLLEKKEDKTIEERQKLIEWKKQNEKLIEKYELETRKFLKTLGKKGIHFETDYFGEPLKIEIEKNKISISTTEGVEFEINLTHNHKELWIRKLPLKIKTKIFNEALEWAKITVKLIQSTENENLF